MNRQMKSYLLMVAILLVVMTVGTSGQASEVHISVGKQYFDIAQTFKNLADFDKSLLNCDKAIGEFQQVANPGTETRSLLAQVYYLKAYLLSIKGAPENTIRDALKLARLTSPETTPPAEYANHPKMKTLLAEAQADSQKDIQAAFDQAQKLFLEDQYCLAADIFAKIAPVYKDPELVRKYLEKSRSACKDAPDPKIEKTGGKPCFGVFPVIYKDQLAHNSDRRVTGRISNNQLYHGLKGLSDKVEFVAVDSLDFKRSMEEEGVKCPEAFIIRWGRIYDYPCSELISGIEDSVKNLDLPDVGVNNLPDDVAGKLGRIAKELNLNYLLFFYIKNKPKGSSGQDISIDVMMYDANQTKKPVVRKTWTNLTMRRLSEKRIEDTAELVQDYLREKGL